MQLTIQLLKQLIENIPDDYTIEHGDVMKTVKTEKIEVDVENKKVIFKG